MTLVTETQIQAAMKFYEAKAGKRDGISICSEVSSLADLLGTMWYRREKTASIKDGGIVHTLLQGAGISLNEEPCADVVLPAESSKG